MRICPNPFLTDRPAQLRIVVITRIIINTGHLKMSLVVAGRKIFPKRLVVAVEISALRGRGESLTILLTRKYRGLLTMKVL